MDLRQVNMEEFKKNIYKEYIKLFPYDELNELDEIEEAINEGREVIYEIIVDNKIVGFIMLERIRKDFPYYVDYFGIFKKYQGKHYGTMAFNYLINNVVVNDGICLEIEKEDKRFPHTLKRAKFYRDLGFKRINSEYLYYNVRYTPYVYDKHRKYTKSDIYKILTSYYKKNFGIKEFHNNFVLIK